MKKVIAYLLVTLILLATGVMGLKTFGLPNEISEIELALKCAMVSALGGILYCLRAVYLNKCVRNQWSAEWEVWYYIRPITSTICGLVAFLFLKAGLVVLDATQNENSGDFGYLAFSFFAGLNVDKFMEKVEDIGKSLFVIEKSRSSKKTTAENKDE